MIWSPDLRITVEQPHLPVLLSSTVAGAWARVRLAAACRRRTKAPNSCPTPRLQWRDRVGIAPTSHDHQEASGYWVSIADTGTGHRPCRNAR